MKNKIGATIHTIQNTHKCPHTIANTPKTHHMARVACTEDEYTCSNGECIPSDRQCDGHTDCENGDDELDCQPTAPVPTDSTDAPELELYPTEPEIDGKSSQT